MLLPAAAAVCALGAAARGGGPHTETPLKATKATKTILLPAAATAGLRSLLRRQPRQAAAELVAARELPYEPPTLLPSPEDAASPPHPRRADSAELPRRFPIATPSVPSLLAEGTSALVVGRDACFVNSAVSLLEAMGIRALGVPSVSDALTALEDDIAEHGCITYDQILCEAGRDGWEGGEALMRELESTSWPASVVIVTPSLPTRKPASAAELGRISFVRLRRLHQHPQPLAVAQELAAL
ncbi:hypothetical protein T492DRAFT_891171 [Pavlovales sp. CCMP2436]|nr:hypothetical protein T492DRAFT_891171 [Pavlovales sp. CCMP2436]